MPAVNLFVSAYDGNVTTLSFTGSGSNYSLSETSRIQGCGTQPSWLVLNKPDNVLYCLDENFSGQLGTPNERAVFTSYSIGDAGKLSVAQSANLSTTSSVSGVLFGGNKYMAVAGYSGQVSALTIDKTDFKQTQIFNYTGKTEPGPVTDRQATSHVHQGIVDPTGQFIVTPDLGADLLHVYCWSADFGPANILEEHPAFKVKAGTGPRHATFWKANPQTNSTDDIYLFLVGELSATVTAYKVSYPATGGLNFTELSTQGTFGGPSVVGTAPAEIQVSPDNKYLIVSNRNDSSFSLDTHANPGSNQTEFSDSLATYEIGQNGTLAFKQLWPAGGLFPRQFAINKAGDLVAVGLGSSCRIVVLSRDVKTGLLGTPVAMIPLGTCVKGATASDTITNGPTCIVWDE